MEYIFVADTNLFFECKRLVDLSWGDLNCDPVVVLLTKPVMDEIDKHKQASGRTRRRALDILGRIREMLKARALEVEIQESAPRVILRLAPVIKPDSGLDYALDYSRNDDKIVGIVSAMRKTAHNSDIFFLTDDTGAAATAHSLDVPYCMIDETWKRPPEESSEAKRIKDLQKDLATYRAQEPSIVIRDTGKDTYSTHVIRRIPIPLNSADIDQLIKTLKTKFPIKEDFSAPKAHVLADGTRVTFGLPETEEIEEYKIKAYPSWIKKCREKFHENRFESEAVVRLVWTIRNDGTRPATQMRVTFEAEGDLLLRRRNEQERASGENINENTVRPIEHLPKPPTVPQIKKFLEKPARLSAVKDVEKFRAIPVGIRGSNFQKLTAGATWLNMQSDATRFINIGRNLNTPGMMKPSRLLSQIDRILEGQRQLYSPMIDINPLVNPADFVLPKHQEEAFYFDKWPAEDSVPKGELTCDLFRHKSGEKLLEFEVVFPENNDIFGAVLCTVHAENLTEPVRERITVSRTIEQSSLLALAKTMIDNCEE